MAQYEKTALMKAIDSDHMETVRVLLAAGADINHMNKVRANHDVMYELGDAYLIAALKYLSVLLPIYLYLLCLSLCGR